MDHSRLPSERVDFKNVKTESFSMLPMLKVSSRHYNSKFIGGVNFIQLRKANLSTVETLPYPNLLYYSLNRL